MLVLVMGLAGLTGGLLTQPPASGIAVDRLPTLARQLLPDVERIVAASCPELPVVWVLAHVQAESSWRPEAFRGDRNGGSAGLYQLNQQNWILTGGTPWASTPPPADADVLQPVDHLTRAVPWVCQNLRTMTAHLAATGKPTSPLDAMLVCHIAGCSRVADSATGVPQAGEAGCGADCAELIQNYIAAVHQLVETYSAPAGPASIAGLRAPAPFTGPSAGCTEDDPTTTGCLTSRTKDLYDELIATFGPPGPDHPIRSITCWDQHAWNPTSDHPKGRACDIFPTRAGTFPQGAKLQVGWAVATWLRTHADVLGIDYLIWQGRYWSSQSGDVSGEWGTRYTGSGIYDTSNATGGHYDHLHVSVR
ncbi:hypothetical protein [Pseudonocardia oroxyli]|nr:hypothetical protein [Pseudonocardia oroxyli]